MSLILLITRTVKLSHINMVVTWMLLFSGAELQASVLEEEEIITMKKKK